MLNIYEICLKYQFWAFYHKIIIVLNSNYSGLLFLTIFFVKFTHDFFG